MLLIGFIQQSNLETRNANVYLPLENFLRKEFVNQLHIVRLAMSVLVP